MLSASDYKELLPFANGKHAVTGAISPRLERLIDSHLLESVTLEMTPTGEYIAVAYKLTLAGEDALSEYERTQDEMRKQESEQKANRKTQVLSAFIGAIVGAVITLLIEHIPDMIRFLRGLFG